MNTANVNVWTAEEILTQLRNVVVMCNNLRKGIQLQKGMTFADRTRTLFNLDQNRDAVAAAMPIVAAAKRMDAALQSLLPLLTTINDTILALPMIEDMEVPDNYTFIIGIPYGQIKTLRAALKPLTNQPGS